MTPISVDGNNESEVVLKVNSVLKEIITWRTANKLRLSSDKTSYIIFWALQLC